MTFLAFAVKSPKFLDNNGDKFMPKWASYTVKEASQVSGYHEEYIRQLLKLGKIDGEKLGYMWLIHVESLEKYMREAEEANANDARHGPHKK